jgi:hypothetical protein
VAVAIIYKIVWRYQVVHFHSISKVGSRSTAVVTPNPALKRDVPAMKPPARPLALR